MTQPETSSRRSTALGLSVLSTVVLGLCGLGISKHSSSIDGTATVNSLDVRHMVDERFLASTANGLALLALMAYSGSGQEERFIGKDKEGNDTFGIAEHAPVSLETQLSTGLIGAKGTYDVTVHRKVALDNPDSDVVTAVRIHTFMTSHGSHESSTAYDFRLENVTGPSGENAWQVEASSGTQLHSPNVPMWQQAASFGYREQRGAACTVQAFQPVFGQAAAVIRSASSRQPVSLLPQPLT